MLPRVLYCSQCAGPTHARTRARAAGHLPREPDPAMKCPYCGFVESRVTDSRDQGRTIHRRRRCERCLQRFSTLERVVLHELIVVKSDGRREPINREKRYNGISLAIQKRPIAGVEIQS